MKVMLYMNVFHGIIHKAKGENKADVHQQMDELTKGGISIHNGCLALKMNAILIHATTWMDL